MTGVFFGSGLTPYDEYFHIYHATVEDVRNDLIVVAEIDEQGAVQAKRIPKYQIQEYCKAKYIQHPDRIYLKEPPKLAKHSKKNDYSSNSLSSPELDELSAPASILAAADNNKSAEVAKLKKELGVANKNLKEQLLEVQKKNDKSAETIQKHKQEIKALKLTNTSKEKEVEQLQTELTQEKKSNQNALQAKTTEINKLIAKVQNLESINSSFEVDIKKLKDELLEATKIAKRDMSMHTDSKWRTAEDIMKATYSNYLDQLIGVDTMIHKLTHLQFLKLMKQWETNGAHIEVTEQNTLFVRPIEGIKSSNSGLQQQPNQQHATVIQHIPKHFQQSRNFQGQSPFNTQPVNQMPYEQSQFIQMRPQFPMHQGTTSSIICRDYLKYRRCSRGNGCRYQHII